MGQRGNEAVVVEVVSSRVGDCLYIDDLRVAGPKPVGFQQVVYKFEVRRAEILTALDLSKDL